MNFDSEFQSVLTRRHFFNRLSSGIGTVALASLLNPKLFGAAPVSHAHGALPALHFAPKAKQCIFLYMEGGVSQIDLFDNKPKLKELTNTELPASVRMGQRITGMTSGQKQLLCVGSPFGFSKHGKSGKSEVGSLKSDCSASRSSTATPRRASAASANASPDGTVTTTSGDRAISEATNTRLAFHASSTGMP